MNGELPISLQIAILAIQIGVILFAARIFGNLAQKIRVPSVLGELIAGIVIGPYILGAIPLPLHGFEHGLFPLPANISTLPVSTPLYAIATLGSIILLFVSGLETDLRMFFRYSVAGTVIGLGGVLFSFCFGAGMGMWMLNVSFMDPRCLFLGILSTATSVGITARILSDKKCIDSPEGTTILAAAVIDDVLGIICLAIVMGIVGASTAKAGAKTVAWGSIGMIAAKSFGIWLGITAAGLLAAHHIAKFLKIFRSSATFSVLAVGLALFLAGMFEEAGLAMIVGAYVMGMCLSKTDIAFTIERNLNGIYNFFVPVFFVVMGMLVDIRVLGQPQVVKYGLIYSGLAVVAKIAGCALPAYFMNFNLLGAIRIGAGMVPRGEVALIIAGIGSTTMMIINGQKEPVIDSELFGITIIMTLLTTVVAPPLLSFVLGIKGRGVRHEVEDHKSVHTDYHFSSEAVRDFVLRVMLDNFVHEGFRYSELDRDGGITRFRRDNTTFTLVREGELFRFDSGESEVSLIKTVMYETFVEIQQALEDLNGLEAPGSLDEVMSSKTEIQDTPTSRNPKIPVRIDRVIGKNAIITDLKADTTEEVIKELVAKLASSGALKNPQLCEQDALAREAIVSTVMPGGVALPHARTDGTDRLVAAIGISSKGCRATQDGNSELTHLYVLSLSPKSAHQPYLQFVAHVAQILANPENVKSIVESNDPDAVRKAFLG